MEDQLGSEDEIEDGELVRVIASAELEEQVRRQPTFPLCTNLINWMSIR